MSQFDTLLYRGVDAIYPSREFLETKLSSGGTLKVYLGIDPTGDLNLHHTIPLFKLRHFQELGHTVYLLIGSFTAMIGDPTGKAKTRVPLTKEQVLENAKNYAYYAGKILDFAHNPPCIVYNADWFEKLTFKEVVELASHFTVQQMIERDMFQERLRHNLPIGLHEFLYPLMQGYDSVVLDVDVEIGGTDQTFNMLAGRKLLDVYSHKEKVVLTVPLLTDEHGRKMSKSDGTGIPLGTGAEDMYGKIMSLPDSFIIPLFIQCTTVDLDVIDSIRHSIQEGQNPMMYKKQLAFDIVSRFYGLDMARSAETAFESVVQHDLLPLNIPDVTVQGGVYDSIDIVFMSGLVDSKSEARRMLQQHAVSVYVDGVEQRLLDPHSVIHVVNGMVVRVGKRRFVRLRIHPS